MAIKSTVFKIQLSVSDIERGYYADHALTIARHPSETDLRMLIRLAVFALNADEQLQFTKGLSSADEPDLWQKSLTGDTEHWIDLGQPTEKRIRQSCSKADRVSIYTFQKGSVQTWYGGIKDDLERFRHLRVVHLAVRDEAAVAGLVDRSMQLSCLINEGEVLLSNADHNLVLDVTVLKDGAPAQRRL